LEEAEEFVHRQHFEFRMPTIAAAQVLTLLHQGDLAAAATLAQKYELPLSQARVYLAQGDPTAALAVLEPLRRQMDEKGWSDEQLKIIILQAVAHDAAAAQADGEKAMQQLAEALTLAEPEGYIRIFVDEGVPMEHLLSEANARGIMPDYVNKLLAAFEAEKQKKPVSPPSQALIDPLSERELEILALIAAGLKNKEIAEQLFITLNTVLYHVKNIYGKLGVNKRTLAIIKARELDLLPDA
jgi:LuxR family maltose regulon positive regulatory protein